MTNKPKISFYRRSLPSPPAVAFSSKKGREVFREALREGGMECYFPLAEQFRTQDEPAYCGLGTLVMVLNALAIDPGKAWKGVWRWYSEEMLDCCKSLNQIKAEGIIMKEFSCLALCNGAEVVEKNPVDNTLAEFRQDVLRVCSDPTCKQVAVVNYSRKGMEQTGDGHYSPIGGYNQKLDLLLIMDVARFKYPPHCAPLEVVYESMKRIDPDSKKCRGWLLLSACPHLNPLVFRWKSSKCLDYFINHIPAPLNLPPKAWQVKVMEYMLKAQVCTVRPQQHCIDLELGPLSERHKEIRESCLRDVRSLPIYGIALTASKQLGLQTNCADSAALSALISVPLVYPEMEKFFCVESGKMPDLAREVHGLRRQLKHSCGNVKHLCEDNVEEKIKSEE